MTAARTLGQLGRVAPCVLAISLSIAPGSAAGDSQGAWDALVKGGVGAWGGPGTLVLVTHALTVRARLGFLPIQGETVVLRPGPGSAAGADLVGLIEAPR